jgi:RNA polymerase sigma factor (sigma-70 family)
MVGGPSVALSRDIQTLFDAGTMAGLTDRQLLDRFELARDRSSEAAFEVLVRRHGPMVLRVCRNTLKDWNDAEDAFQATFVILARRCGSIRRRDSVQSWLFGVACRVAARARVAAARRRAVERRGAAEAGSTLDAHEGGKADLPAVQEEVRRLPEKFRSALVLCYWEGLTQEQAAARLGCPLGTLRSRLARARDLLRRRLTRRGVAPMAGIAAPGFSDVASTVPLPAAVPDSWVAASVKAVSCGAAGGGPATAGAVPMSVALLVQDVFRRMVMTKLKLTAVCLSLIGIGAAGAIVAAPQAGPGRPASTTTRGPQADQSKASASASGTSEARRKTQPLPSWQDYVIEPPDLIRVDVLEALPGRPISGERLVRPDGKITLGFYGDVYVAGLTLAEAKAKVVEHLRKYLSDDVLGLLERDRATGDYKRDDTSRLVRKAPGETDRVLLDVIAHNSKNYYVLGDVRHPGRYPLTGNETVLDALNDAGGLPPSASPQDIRLVRPAPPGACCEQVLPVDLAALTDGGDPTTNDQLMPGDRLIVQSKREAAADGSTRGSIAPRERSEESRGTRRHESAIRAEPADDRAPRAEQGAEGRSPLRDLERRLGEVERKLDRVLDALERRE